MDLVVYPQLKWQAPESAALSAYEGGVNCAAAGGAALVALGTGGAKKPTHHAFRVAAGNPMVDGLPIGLSTFGIMQALDHFGVQAARKSLVHFSVVRDALQDGLAVGALVDYPTINAYKGGKYSGQLTFRGGHFVVLKGFRKSDPRVNYLNSTTDHDPLFDDRCKAWGCAPDGPQVVPFGLIRAALRNFRIGPERTYAEREPLTTFGDDLGIFIVVQPG